MKTRSCTGRYRIGNCKLSTRKDVPTTTRRQIAMIPLVVFAVILVVLTSSARAEQIAVDFGELNLSNSPSYNNNAAERADFDNSFDFGPSSTFLTAPSPGSGSHMAVYNFADGPQSFDRIRINQLAGNDGNGNVTMNVYYYNGPDVPFVNRSYAPVTGLSLSTADFGDGTPAGAAAGNTFTHSNMALDGFYSLQFDPVTAQGFAIEFDTAGSFTHYGVRDIAPHFGVSTSAAPVAVNDRPIDIVAGVVSPGPARTATGSEFTNSFDGDVGTSTFMTQSGTTGTPQFTRLDFEGDGHLLSRIRINDVAGNDGNGVMEQITVRYTTDTDPDLNARTYHDVTNLAVVVAEGSDDSMPLVTVVDNTISHFDTLHDGFYSITFDPIPGATGIEFEWNNTGNFKHWTVREFEAFAAVPESSSVAQWSLIGMIGLGYVILRRKRNGRRN